MPRRFRKRKRISSADDTGGRWAQVARSERSFFISEPQLKFALGKIFLEQRLELSFVTCTPFFIDLAS
jgi:hypothetical protein